MIEAEKANGDKIYIGQDGNTAFREQSVKKPFYSAGTAVVMENGILGTALHINPDRKTVGSAELASISTQISEESGTTAATRFEANLQNAFLEHNLIHPDKGSWQLRRVNSFIILPQAPIESIQGDLEKSPFKTPSGCFMTTPSLKNEERDIQVHFLPKKPKGIEGLRMDDIMNEEELSNLENIEDRQIFTYGYPASDIQRQVISPQADLNRQITKLPDATYEYIVTDLQSYKGSSGSFVIHKQSGKVCGVVISKEQTNTSNVICSPAFVVRKLYDMALKSSPSE